MIKPVLPVCYYLGMVESIKKKTISPGLTFNMKARGFVASIPLQTKRKTIDSRELRAISVPENQVAPAELSSDQLHSEVARLAKRISQNKNILGSLKSLNQLMTSSQSLDLSHFVTLMNKLSQCRFDFQNPDITRELSKVLRFLRSQLVQRKDFVFDAPSVASLIYGLRNIDSTIVPKSFLLTIARKISNVEKLDRKSIRDILYGLQNLNPEMIPRKLWLAIARKLMWANDLSPQNAANALYGLQNHTYADIKRSPELRYIARKLLEKVSSISDIVHLAQAINGTKGFAALSKRVLQTKLNALTSTEYNKETLKGLIHAITIFNFVNPENKLELPEEIKASWRVRRKILNKEPVTRLNQLDKKILEDLQQRLPERIFANYTTKDGIELDFYHPGSKTNLEVDGVLHQIEYRKDELRDRYLKSQNIKVIRVPFGSTAAELIPNLSAATKEFIASVERLKSRVF